MRIKEFNIPKNLWLALKEFFYEDGIDKASILAYYSIFSSLFLLTFFTFLFTRFLGDPDLTLKTIYPFSPDFFSRVSPDIFKRANAISTKLEEVGLIGILFAFFLGFLVIKKIVQYVNGMFHVNLKAKRSEKGFWIRRVSEFGLLFLLGLLVVVSFFFTAIFSAIISLIQSNEFLAANINSDFIEAINHFLVKYLVPFLITLLFFFILYKWIPEKKVYVKGAFIAALISSVLWEIVKRGYTFYLINISILGKIKGPIIAIILFGFWMELSMGIMLYGAKLAYVFDRQKKADKGKNDKPKRDKPKSKRPTKREPQPTN
ncbi:MAG: YihY/virulence factor BrkB family protein [Candidatus Aminicenantes bacterium]|jgi:membrane protein